MDNVVTVCHGGSVEEDEFGNVSFVGMRRVPLIFDDRPLLSELFGRAREELHCNSNEDAISVEGILHFGKSGRIFRRLVPIASEGEWEKYVKTVTVIKNEFQCLDLVVRKLSNDPTTHGYSPPNGPSPLGNLAPSDPPLANREVEVEDVVLVPDAQSSSNEVGIFPYAQSATTERRVFPELGTGMAIGSGSEAKKQRVDDLDDQRRVFPELGTRMAIDSVGSGSEAKRQRVDDQDDCCEAVASDAVLVDRISVLPDELRLHVLTHLPLKAAIRTGVLARGWRNLWRGRWTHHASLEVHIRSRNDLQREMDALALEPRPRRRLEHFSLIVGISFLKASELRRFLDYTEKCGVEDLHVETRKSTTASKLNFYLPLSSHSLACLSLRNITVSMYQFYYEGRRRPFHALEVIQLRSVSFRPEAFKEMMELCPNLLTLDLQSCSCGEGWVFYNLSPNLRSLTIMDCGRIKSLVLVPTLRSFRYSGYPSILPLSIPPVAALSDLYIDISFSGSASLKGWNIDKLRKSLPKDLSSLNVLTICYRALTGVSVLSADGASAQLPNFSLHSLKELHLLMYEKKKSVNLPNLYLFLKTFQCPNLERLFVQLPEYRLNPTEDSIDQVWEEPTEDCLDNLVMVKVMNFNWCPSEVQLVSFLLRKARSLCKLLIVSRNVTPVDLPGAAGADLLLLKEALVNGKIMFTDSDNATTRPYHEAFIKL